MFSLSVWIASARYRVYMRRIVNTVYSSSSYRYFAIFIDYTVRARSGTGLTTHGISTSCDCVSCKANTPGEAFSKNNVCSACASNCSSSWARSFRKSTHNYYYYYSICNSALKVGIVFRAAFVRYGTQSRRCRPKFPHPCCFFLVLIHVASQAHPTMQCHV